MRSQNDQRDLNVTLAAGRLGLSRSAFTDMLLGMFAPFDPGKLARFLVEKYPTRIDDLAEEIARLTDRKAQAE